MAQCEEEQVKYDEAVVTLKAETQQYQDEKEVHETKLIGLRKTVNEKEAELKITESELQLLTSNEQKEKCKLETFR